MRPSRVTFRRAAVEAAGGVAVAGGASTGSGKAFSSAGAQDAGPLWKMHQVYREGTKKNSPRVHAAQPALLSARELLVPGRRASRGAVNWPRSVPPAGSQPGDG